MYKYDKENDRIIKQGNYIEARIFSHDELQALREALGLKRHSEQKYTVKVIKGDKLGYLNIRMDGIVFLDDNKNIIPNQTFFTQKEIDELKQRDDLAIDWNKAIISPVEE